LHEAIAIGEWADTFDDIANGEQFGRTAAGGLAGVRMPARSIAAGRVSA
jgi:hypothetical protein